MIRPTRTIRTPLHSVTCSRSLFQQEDHCRTHTRRCTGVAMAVAHFSGASLLELSTPMMGKAPRLGIIFYHMVPCRTHLEIKRFIRLLSSQTPMHLMDLAALLTKACVRNTM